MIHSTFVEQGGGETWLEPLIGSASIEFDYLRISMKTLYAPALDVLTDFPETHLKSYLADLEVHVIHQTSSLYVPVAVDDDGEEYWEIWLSNGLSYFKKNGNLHVASSAFTIDLTVYTEALEEALSTVDSTPALF